MTDHLSSRFADLNPFIGKQVEDDDRGDIIFDETGHASRKSDFAKGQLRVSNALRSFIADKKILSEEDAGVDSEAPAPALKRLLETRSFEAPASLLDRTHAFPEYYVSSSHNTYLLAHQLYGSSAASAYETAIKTGSRCVEIDAWDNSDNPQEPKVTHGYTFVTHIPFRAVCETIAKVYDEEVELAKGHPSTSLSPILISLENHCGAAGQLRLVQIFKEVLGHRLLSAPVRDKGTDEQNGGEHVTLEELGPKIAVIVEFHLGTEASEITNESEEEGENEEERIARKTYEAKKLETASVAIVPELAELGVYAQSVKPKDNSWFDPGQLLDGPHHHLINVSESGLSSHLPPKAALISRHNAHHLMRVFPKGTRISSSNLRPLKFWGIGAQICALNWQTFATSNQLNDALFAGSSGYVLKPAALRAGGDGNLSTGRRRKLRLHVAGATDIPLHDEREANSIKPYLTCQLYSPLEGDGDPPKRKTAPYKHHKLGFLHRGENPPATDPIWDETLEWEYEDNELVFVRMLIKSDDAWARNPKFAAVAVRLLYATPGWTFIRMMDMKGKESECTIFVKFEFVDL